MIHLIKPFVRSSFIARPQKKYALRKLQGWVLTLGAMAAILGSASCVYEFQRDGTLEPGEIRGRLVKGNGEAAAYASIWISGRPTSQTADSNGAFSVRDLSSGRWLLRFQYDQNGDGWVEQSAARTVVLETNAHPEGLFGSTVKLEGVDLGDVGLNGVASVDGVVHDASGSPLGGAKVVATVTHSTSENALGFTYEEATVTSASDGEYHFAALPGDEVRVMSFHPANPLAVSPAHRLDLGGGSVADPIPLIVPPQAPNLRQARLNVEPLGDDDDVVFVEFVAPGTPPSEVDFASSDPRLQAATSPLVLEQVRPGLWDLYVQTSSGKVGAAFLRVVHEGDGVLDLGTLLLFDVLCPDDDCDQDGLVGLPPYDENPALWAACAATTSCDQAFGAQTAEKTCSVDGTDYDCDDDDDGQSDISEPTCYGLGLGTDLDSDLICYGEDPYPYCFANDETCNPDDVTGLSPVPLPSLNLADAGVLNDAGNKEPDAGLVDLDGGVFEGDGGGIAPNFDAGSKSDAGIQDAGPPPFNEWRLVVEASIGNVATAYPQSYALPDGRMVFFQARKDVPSNCPLPNLTTFTHVVLVMNADGDCESTFSWQNGFETGVDAGVETGDSLFAKALGVAGDELFLFASDFGLQIEVSAISLVDGATRSEMITIDVGNGNGYSFFDYGSLLEDGSIVLIGNSQDGSLTFTGGGGSFDVLSGQYLTKLVSLHLSSSNLILSDVQFHDAPGNPDYTEYLGNLRGIVPTATGYLLQGEDLEGQLFNGDIDSANGNNWVAAFDFSGTGPSWTSQFTHAGAKFHRNGDELWMTKSSPSSLEGFLAYDPNATKTDIILNDGEILTAAYVSAQDYAWIPGTDHALAFNLLFFQSAQTEVTEFSADPNGSFFGAYFQLEGWVTSPAVDPIRDALFALRSSPAGLEVVRYTLSDLGALPTVITQLSADELAKGSLAYDRFTGSLYVTFGEGISYVINVDDSASWDRQDELSQLTNLNCTSIGALGISDDGQVLGVYCTSIVSSDIIAVYFDGRAQTSASTLLIGEIAKVVPNTDGSNIYLLAMETGYFEWNPLEVTGVTSIPGIDFHQGMAYIGPSIAKYLHQDGTSILEDLSLFELNPTTGAPLTSETIFFANGKMESTAGLQFLNDGTQILSGHCSGDLEVVDSSGSSFVVGNEAAVRAALSDTSEICLLKINENAEVLDSFITRSTSPQRIEKAISFPDGSVGYHLRVSPEVNFKETIGHDAYIEKDLLWRAGVNGPQFNAPSPSLNAAFEWSPGDNRDVKLEHIIALDDGNMLITGTRISGEFFENDPDCDLSADRGVLFMAKATPQGDCLWSATMGKVGTPDGTTLEDIALGNNGEIYVALQNAGAVNYHDGISEVSIDQGEPYTTLVLHYSAAGNVLGLGAVFAAAPLVPGVFLDFSTDGSLYLGVHHGGETVREIGGGFEVLGSRPGSVLVEYDSVLALIRAENFEDITELHGLLSFPNERVMLAGRHSNPLFGLPGPGPQTPSALRHFLVVLDRNNLVTPLLWSAEISDGAIEKISLSQSPGKAWFSLNIQRSASLLISITNNNERNFPSPTNASSALVVPFSLEGDNFILQEEISISSVDIPGNPPTSVPFTLMDVQFGSGGSMHVLGNNTGSLTVNMPNVAPLVFGSIDNNISVVSVARMSFGSNFNVWNALAIGTDVTAATAFAVSKDDDAWVVGTVASDNGLSTPIDNPDVGPSVAPALNSSFFWSIPGDGRFVNPN